MINKPKYIIIHCTDYSYKLMPNQFEACNSWHKDRGFPKSSLGLYIGYHSLITGDTNYPCRLETDEGAHCNQVVDGLSMNFQSLGVCIGFDGDIEMPTDKQYELLQKQVWEWQDKHGIPSSNVKFHRYYSLAKTCPGSLVTEEWLNKLLIRPINTSNEKCIDNSEIMAIKSKLSLYETLIGSILKLIDNFKSNK